MMICAVRLQMRNQFQVLFMVFVCLVDWGGTYEKGTQDRYVFEDWKMIAL